MVMLVKLSCFLILEFIFRTELKVKLFNISVYFSICICIRMGLQI